MDPQYHFRDPDLRMIYAKLCEILAATALILALVALGVLFWLLVFTHPAHATHEPGHLQHPTKHRQCLCEDGSVTEVGCTDTFAHLEPNGYTDDECERWCEGHGGIKRGVWRDYERMVATGEIRACSDVAWSWIEPGPHLLRFRCTKDYASVCAAFPEQFTDPFKPWWDGALGTEEYARIGRSTCGQMGQLYWTASAFVPYSSECEGVGPTASDLSPRDCLEREWHCWDETTHEKSARTFQAHDPSQDHAELAVADCAALDMTPHHTGLRQVPCLGVTTTTMPEPWCVEHEGWPTVRDVLTLLRVVVER